MNDMIQSYSIADEYLYICRKFLLQCWSGFGPLHYIVVLVSIAMIGWFVMARKAGTYNGF